LGLLDGDRLRVLDEEVDRSAGREVLSQRVETARLVEAVTQLLGRRLLARGGSRAI
jgi:hypothetical protein